MIYIEIYSLVIILGILIDFLSKFGIKKNLSTKLYLVIICSVIFYTFLQLGSILCFENKIINFILSTFGYIFLMISSLGILLYTKSTFLNKSDDMKKTYKHTNFYFIIYLFILITYGISEDVLMNNYNIYNNYIKVLIYVLCSIPLFMVVVDKFKNKVNSSPNGDKKMILIPLIPVLGMLLDLAFATYDFIVPAYTCTILIIYLYCHDVILNIDPLTGIYNRRILDDQIYNRANNVNISRKDNNKLTAAYIIDIDHFKRFNDDFGHDVGDLALKNVGEILRKSVRKTDYPIRIGGDEFLIIAIIDDEKNIHKIVDSIHENLKEYNEVHQERPISLSVGYDIYKTGEMLEQLIVRIDKKMYDEKDKHHREMNK